MGLLLGLGALFVAKIVWNLSAPYILQLRRSEGQGVALMPYLEIALLSLIVLASSFAAGDSWLHRPVLVGAIGVAVVLGSYLHFLIANLALGWLLARRRSSRNKTDGAE